MNKNKFVKIFEYDDMDIVIMKEWNDKEERPELLIKTIDNDGICLSLYLGYNTVEDRETIFNNDEILLKISNQSRNVFTKLITTQK